MKRTLIKGSSSGHVRLIRWAEIGPMEMTRRPTDDLLDVTRALLLFQAAILIATTIEALIWAAIFPGAGGSPAFMSGASAIAILVARSHLRADRRWSRRLVYLVQGLILAALAIDATLAIALAGSLPPLVQLLTQLVLPISVIALLRRSSHAQSLEMMEGAS